VIADKTAKKKLKKKDLIKHLQDIGIQSTGTLHMLQELCRLHNLPIEIIEQKNLEGWETPHVILKKRSPYYNPRAERWES
jgi:aminoglycoside N3'-acetyltransferase